MATYGELLAAGRFYAGSVCVDCLMGLANGDWPDDTEPDWTSERRNNVGATLEQCDITLGHIHSGEYAGRCWHAGEICADDCNCEQSEFSWSSCSVCGSGLGGYRHDVIMISYDDLS